MNKFNYLPATNSKLKHLLQIYHHHHCILSSWHTAHEANSKIKYLQKRDIMEKNHTNIYFSRFKISKTVCNWFLEYFWHSKKKKFSMFHTRFWRSNSKHLRLKLSEKDILVMIFTTEITFSEYNQKKWCKKTFSTLDLVNKFGC